MSHEGLSGPPKKIVLIKVSFGSGWRAVASNNSLSFPKSSIN